jgi:hypothetical protein
MLTARKANELTTEAVEREIATRQTRAMEFCNNLDEQIVKACEERQNKLTIETIPTEIKAYVIKIFQDYGYEIKQMNQTTIQIYW